MEYKIIQDELEQVHELLQKKEELFNLAEEDELIEAIIYEQKALRLRYDYLLRKAKEHFYSNQNDCQEDGA
ncbi:MAG: DUF2508 family protein [Oscillospiraceae bacterium]|nr:DUF2508 family protein [Oscillospiraceae bacterium]